MDDHNNYEPFDAFGVVHQTLVDGCAVIEQQNNRDIESMARLLGVTDEWLDNLKKPLTTEMDEKLRDDQAIRDLIYYSAVHSDPAGGYIDLPPGAMRQMPAYSEPSKCDPYQPPDIVTLNMPYTPPEETPTERYVRLAQSVGYILKDSWVVALAQTTDKPYRIAIGKHLLDRLKCRLRHHLEKRLDYLLWLIESERIAKWNTTSTAYDYAYTDWTHFWRMKLCEPPAVIKYFSQKPNPPPAPDGMCRFVRFDRLSNDDPTY